MWTNNTQRRPRWTPVSLSFTAIKRNWVVTGILTLLMMNYVGSIMSGEFPKPSLGGIIILIPRVHPRTYSYRRSYTPPADRRNNVKTKANNLEWSATLYNDINDNYLDINNLNEYRSASGLTKVSTQTQRKDSSSFADNSVTRGQTLAHSDSSRTFRRRQLLRTPAGSYSNESRRQILRTPSGSYSKESRRQILRRPAGSYSKESRRHILRRPTGSYPGRSGSDRPDTKVHWRSGWISHKSLFRVPALNTPGRDKDSLAVHNKPNIVQKKVEFPHTYTVKKIIGKQNTNPNVRTKPNKSTSETTEPKGKIIVRSIVVQKKFQNV